MSFGGNFHFEEEQATEVVQTTTTTTRYRVCFKQILRERSFLTNLKM
jgi:hypothetical protein